MIVILTKGFCWGLTRDDEGKKVLEIEQNFTAQHDGKTANKQL